MSARSPRLPSYRPRPLRSGTSAPGQESQQSSDPVSESPAELAVDAQSAEALKRLFAAVAAWPDEQRFSEPDELRSDLAIAASVTGEQWDKILDASGPAERRAFAACLRSEQWDRMLVAAGSDGRQVLWKIMERVLSTFARRKSASTACDIYRERQKREPRPDSLLAIRLAAAAAVARTLDGALWTLPRWAVWPLLEIDYEQRPAHLYTFVQTCFAVEHLLLSPVPVEHGATTLRHPDVDLSRYLDAIRQQLARSIASRNTAIAAALVNELSPAPRRDAHRQEDLVFRAFYVGVRLTFEQVGQGEPTSKDVADLWLGWDIEPTDVPKQVRERWRKRINACQRYFNGINST